MQLNRKRLLTIAGLLAAGLMTMGNTSCDYDTSATRDRATAEANQSALQQSSPAPILKRSEERENLIKRAERLNQANMIGCVSIYFPNGVLLYQGLLDGKVSSLNSYLLPGDRLATAGESSMTGNVTVESPDIDGAYGENAEGVFMFGAETDAYIEAGGALAYFYTDQCLKTEQRPLLVRQVADEDAPAAAPAPAPNP